MRKKNAESKSKEEYAAIISMPVKATLHYDAGSWTLQIEEIHNTYYSNQELAALKELLKDWEPVSE